jgi:hypothetical protein
VHFCNNFRPDIILLAHADIIEPETIALLRHANKRMIVGQYNIDSIYAPNNLAKIHSKAHVVDMTFITTAGKALTCVAKNRSKAAFIPNPTDSSIEVYSNFESADLPIDVFFAGQLSDYSDSDDLRNSIGKLKEDLPHLEISLQNSLWGSDFTDMLRRARIGLSLSSAPASRLQAPEDTLYLYSSDRISQYLGNGLMTITEKIFSLSCLYGTSSLVEVSDYQELVEKLDYFSRHKNEAADIARTGWEVAHNHFNERLVARYMVETLMGGSCSGDYKWPTRIWCETD